MKRKKIISKQVPNGTLTFPIVAIGASAGGLEAVSELLKNLSPDTGMAFLYVQHLSPDHKSLLDSLLTKMTSMKVREAVNKEKMLPDHVYVIPPDKEMNIMDGYIKITPRPESPKVNFPIDILFASLAESHKENVIGIILSGSATDGTRGMKAIKHEGGLTFAQDDTAKFGSMPKSAIAAGAVDFVLSPREIALEISRLSKHPFIQSNRNKKEKEKEIDNNDPELKTILNLMHKAHGVDFSQYKMNTIKRRIMRRMLLYKIKSLKEYVKLLQEKPNEPDILYQDLLINVTAFFRDTKTHQYLKTTLLPKLLKSKKPDETLRIWVAACATGEEAYSIAIALLEIQSNKFTNIPVQIFATDLDANAINKARIGDYSKMELEEVSPKRLQRFYVKSQNGYRVAKQVRDMCIFAQHNILTDPPFAHVDFVSCCNLLIYLDTVAQKKAIATVHYALNDNGFLMLGKSESIGPSTQFFSAFNKSFKIFQRKNNLGGAPLPVLTPRYTRYIHPEVNAVTNGRKTFKRNPSGSAGLDKAIDAVMLSRYMPASVIINEQLDILQFRGATDLYISPSTGKATLNILRMTRPEIAFELRTAISKAIKSKQSVRRFGIELKVNDVFRNISIEVVPLKIEWDEPLLLILFTEQEQAQPTPEKVATTKGLSAAKDRRIKKLEEQLDAARADMLAFTQEQEALNEELQSANEEVVSSNKELQTINEELETSKEEIESANEELSTTNQELQTRNELLNESYLYSETLLLTVPLPLLILDSSMRIKSANKAFYKKFNVAEEETEGYRIYDVGNRQWNIPKLRNLLENIIPQNMVFENFEVEHEFETIGKKVMLLNARRIQLSGQQLILLAIADITEVRNLEKEKARVEKNVMQEKIDAEKKISEALKSADAYIRNVFMQAPVSIALFKGPSFIVDMINEKGLEIWGTTLKKVINKPLFEISPELRDQGLEKILAEVYTSGEPYIGHEIPTHYNRNGKLHYGFFNFTLHPVRDLNGSIIGITSVGTEVTEEVIARKKIEDSETLFHFIADAMPQKVWTADATGNRTYFNKQWLDYTGMTLEELTNDGWKHIIHPDDLKKTNKRWKQSLESGQDFEVEDRKRDRNGQYKWHLSRAIPFRDEAGNITMWIGTNTEVEKQKLQSLEFETAVKERTKELQEQKDFSETIINTTIDLIVVYDIQMRIIEFNKACEDLFHIKKEDVIGKTLTEVFPLAKGAPGEKDVQRSLKGETIHNVMVKSPVSGRYYENFITPLKNAAGEIYATVVIAHDITDRIEAIETLKQSEEKFIRLFESSPFSISLTDETGKIIDVNENYLEMTGYRREEVIGQTSSGLKMMENELRDKIYERLTKEGSIKNTEVEIRIKSGKLVPVLVSTESIIINQQKYFLHALNDITIRKKSEREIEQKNKDLEKMNKELEAFTYISSHDLQEPLRKIQTFATRLLEKENQNLSDIGKDYFLRMQKAANRMQTLIRDLLAFSRINMSERKFELTDLGIILREVQSEFKEPIKEKNATLEIGEMCEIKIIPFLFRQLMHNLFSNALKFSKPGTAPHITISCEKVSAHSSGILSGKSGHHIIFTDNGIGFEQRFSENIFQLFQRLHSKDAYPGTGIGLAIVKKIVENHNGIITATGKPDKGARFDIYIPS